MKSSTKRGAFADLIRVVLDESNLFSRAEWANLLEVTEAILDCWVEGGGIPSPAELRKLGSVLHKKDGVPQWILDRWKAEEHRPWRGTRMIPERTMSQYMARPVLEGFLNVLRCLRGDRQEEVLYKAGELAREALAHQIKEGATHGSTTGRLAE